MSARSRESHVPVGPLVAAVGALLLIVSLFAEWYEGLTGFTVFEFNDLLLVALAIATVVALMASMGLVRADVSPGVALAIAVVAVLVVLSQIVNDPPAVAGDNGRDQDTGIWLALAGSILMLAGAVLSSVRLAIAFEPRRRGVAPAGTRVDEAPTVADESPPRP